MLLKENNELINIQVRPEIKDGNTTIGVSLMPQQNEIEKWQVKDSKTLYEASIQAVQKVYNLSLLNLSIIGKIIIGQASYKHLSGPISIANYAGQSINLGINSFLYFLALISIGLGIINLLPIPMLDGGHLFFLLIEFIKGAPIKEKSQEYMTKIGLTFIIFIMSIAIYNDIILVTK